LVYQNPIWYSEIHFEIGYPYPPDSLKSDMDTLKPNSRLVSAQKLFFPFTPLSPSSILNYFRPSPPPTPLAYIYLVSPVRPPARKRRARTEGMYILQSSNPPCLTYARRVYSRGDRSIELSRCTYRNQTSNIQAIIPASDVSDPPRPRRARRV
jgi:hypothetical protein